MKTNTYSRRDFLKFAGSTVSLFSLGGCIGKVGKDSKIQRTNFVIVLCDDLGYGDLACYGHKHIKSPHLDKFAKEGMKLSDCYAAAPVCSPARTGMLTGRTPWRSGIYDWIPENSPMHLKKEEKTIAALLRDAGYDTCHVGKWHCNGKFNSKQQPQPGDHGFNWWFSTQNNASPSHIDPINFVRNGAKVGRLKGHSSDIIVEEAIGWLENHRDKTRPFCLFVWFHSPHEPVATEEKFMKMYPKQKEVIYWANVTQTDYAFGHLLNKLDEMELRDNCFVMFTSDNGPETWGRYGPRSQRSYGTPGPLRGMKLHLYEGGIRVPGIIQWPGHTKPGTNCDEPVNATDIQPTLCDIAGVDIPNDRAIDGASIFPIFNGKHIKRKIPLYWRYDNALSKPYQVAMRDGDWKILSDSQLTTFELYNLKEDIAETNNLADKMPVELKALKRKLTPLHNQIAAESPNWTSTP